MLLCAYQLLFQGPLRNPRGKWTDAQDMGPSLKPPWGGRASTPGAARLVEAITIAPGQALPLPIHLTLPPSPSCHDALNVSFRVTATFPASPPHTFNHTLPLGCKPFGHAYTFTFLDADGSVQYAAAKAPIKPCPTSGCAVVLALHGADVDAASRVWADAIPAQEAAWVVFPTNRDKYGFDWQGVGNLDTRLCLDYFADILPGVAPDKADSYAVDVSRILFTGHSMGGHGCLIFSTHFPDLALGAVCAAGWIRYDQYVDEFPGVQSSFEDPSLNAVLMSAVADYHTDVAAVNLKGIPFMARMGSDDTNVCPWNLRRFARVLDEINGAPESAVISEVAGEPHWWGDVLSADVVQDFFKAVLAGDKPALPKAFRVRAMNLWHGGRGGVRIAQFHAPFTSAWIDVGIHGGVWRMATTNVRRFRMGDVAGLKVPAVEELWVDGRNLTEAIGGRSGLEFVQKVENGQWAVSGGDAWRVYERYERNGGPMRQVLYGKVAIVYGTPAGAGEALARHAVRLANRMLAHGHGLAMVRSDQEAIESPEMVAGRNLILIGGPDVNALSARLLPRSTAGLTAEFGPRNSEESGDSTTSGVPAGSGFCLCGVWYRGPNIGLAMLGAFNATEGGAHLFALAAGTDLAGMGAAVGLLPVGANREIPDYVVAGPRYTWQSSGGFLAAGYFGNNWRCRPDLSYPRSPAGTGCGAGERGPTATTAPIFVT
ncbi:unnamed protein product [Ostreobium quekettii]|uniref:Peptidase S9 prolyl oligopeptidase catalytic domain-containing protein n=1 Tax=Ostreobium quekettii TaxID=121088 RepID=A0A8S1IPG3_9CHLO|nr:unnamed protein product [Ostreobium quekettii]